MQWSECVVIPIHLLYQFEQRNNSRRYLQHNPNFLLDTIFNRYLKKRTNTFNCIENRFKATHLRS